MNIQQAKEEILRTIRAYRRKDSAGIYEIPPEQQRPILLMGPPGIGKTAIMRQIAEEAGISLVSYTITHHTRQSAIGLPMISHRIYDGTDYAVTEYTMSELVGSVYDAIEKTGSPEGILFLDEINCVSETLAPTMLQFLQYKTFGTHRVPEGWLIVTAGNPPQYNRSAREFDIVTLDRVKRMDIEADFSVWKEYAYRAGIHGAILTFLELKQQNFYVIRTELDGRHFVTARGWEDLSRMLFSYEKMGEDVSEQMIVQYLQDAETARDFAVYYDLYRRYEKTWRVKDILDGAPVKDPEAFRNIPFDEKYSLIRLLTDGLHQEFELCTENESVQKILYEKLLEIRRELENDTEVSERGLFTEAGERLRLDLQRRRDTLALGADTERQLRLACNAWDELILMGDGGAADRSPDTAGPVFSTARTWFAGREQERMAQAEAAGTHLTNAFSFLHHVYGNGQELVIFLSELNADWHCLRFIRNNGNEAYERFSQLLLLHDRQEALRRELRQMQL